ncbi:ORF024 [Staphylococcus phage 96]|uniref:ORF024 n=1 Tax=Staphylococcus phage 96 TaxID=2936815 RepID=Q4ZBS7_9CAUD|nr:ORF024 [Staphylococcus phage 96]
MFIHISHHRTVKFTVFIINFFNEIIFNLSFFFRCFIFIFLDYFSVLFREFHFRYVNHRLPPRHVNLSIICIACFNASLFFSISLLSPSSSADINSLSYSYNSSDISLLATTNKFSSTSIVTVFFGISISPYLNLFLVLLFRSFFTLRLNNCKRLIISSSSKMFMWLSC